MFPIIDKRETGVKLRRLMDERGLTVKAVQEYLNLTSVQSVYHWLNGQSMPTVDNLYALSALFEVSVDSMICGNRDSEIAFDNRYDYVCYKNNDYIKNTKKKSVA